MVAFVLAASLSACGTASDKSVDIPQSQASEQSQTQNRSNDESLSDASSVPEGFTENDFETGYSDEINITLKNGSSASDGAGVTISGNTVTIASAGTYKLSGELTDGQIIVDAGAQDKIKLVLSGVDISNVNLSALYVKQADKVYVTTEANTENTLGTSNVVSSESDTDGNIDGVIFSKSDITFNGEGMLKIDAGASHAIVSKDDLKIASGTYEISSAKKGLQGKDLVGIAGGSVTVNSGTEGIESLKIAIFDGSLDITSSDDGINASTDSAQDTPIITIAGGKIKISAEGDGLDSNGDIVISGGETVIDGPVTGGNGSLDYQGSAKITGGIFLTAGSSSMAMNFGNESTQGSILVTLSSGQSAGSAISLKDASGRELYSYTPSKQYQAVLISTPDIKTGEAYTLTAGNYSTDISMDSVIYGQGLAPDQGGGHGTPPGMAGGFSPFSQDNQRP